MSEKYVKIASVEIEQWPSLFRGFQIQLHDNKTYTVLATDGSLDVLRPLAEQVAHFAGVDLIVEGKRTASE